MRIPIERGDEADAWSAGCRRGRDERNDDDRATRRHAEDTEDRMLNASGVFVSLVSSVVSFVLAVVARRRWRR